MALRVPTVDDNGLFPPDIEDRLEGMVSKPGPPGAGVPEGGAPLQVIRKTSAGNTTEWVTPTKSMVGLSRVDNTTDAEKPLSKLQAEALLSKADLVDGKVPAAQVNLEAVTTTNGARPVGKGELYVNVRDYGAKGNARDDDTAALQAAVAEAFRTGAVLFWPNGGYLTTGSIPNLHRVRHRGNGYILRDGASFFVEPRANNNNTLHVSPTGLTTNDGLSPSQPCAVQAGLDSLSNYGPTLNGQWTIQHGAGIYPGGYGVPRILMRQKLKFQGPPMGGPRVTPAAIYERGESAIDWGVYTVDRAQVSFSDLKFVGFNRTTINSGGIRVGEYNSVDLWNIHTDGCELGFFAMDHVVYNYGGCYFLNSRYAAIHELYMTLRNSTALTTADRTVMEGNQFGFKSKELNTGHADRTEFIGNDYAIHLSRSSTMNFSYSTFRRNKNCVVVAGSSTFVDLYTTFGAGPERNTVKYRYMDGAANVALARTENAVSAPYIGMSEKSMAYGTMPGKHMGTTNDTQIVPLGKFLSGDFQGQGAWIRWEAYGSTNLSVAGTLRLRVGGQGVATITMPTGIYNFKFEGRMYVTADGDTQRADSMLSYSTGNPVFGGGHRTVPIGTVSTDSAIGIFMALGATADSIQIDQAALFTSDM